MTNTSTLRCYYTVLHYGDAGEGKGRRRGWGGRGGGRIVAAVRWLGLFCPGTVVYQAKSVQSYVLSVDYYLDYDLVLISVTKLLSLFCTGTTVVYQAKFKVVTYCTLLPRPLCAILSFFPCHCVDQC